MSLQEDLQRINVDTEAVLQAVKGFPNDAAPTGEVGLPADAIIQWDEIDPGKRTQDFTIAREEYIKRTIAGSALQWNVDPGWLNEEDAR